MKEEMSTLISKSTPLFPKRLDGTKIGEVNAVRGVKVLRRQSLNHFGHLVSEFSVAREQLEENKPRARRGLSCLRIYAATLNLTT